MLGGARHHHKHVQVVELEKAKAQEYGDTANAIKAECEVELSVAMPVLQDALCALDTIKEADIISMRKLTNPPAVIKAVMEATCVLLSVKPAKGKDESGKSVDDWWKPSVAMLNEKDFLQRLRGYDKSNIPPKARPSLLQPLSMLPLPLAKPSRCPQPTRSP
jgi:dynein heavy chain, axonemal